MKATLQIDTPESCWVCPEVDKTASTKSYYCRHIKSEYNYVTDYTYSRHPDCPLVIEEKKHPHWQYKEAVDSWWFACSECDYTNGCITYPECPSCGMKLDPPLESEA
jgi:hypothetical protein